MSHFYEALWAACRKRGRSAPSNLFAEAHAGGWGSVVFSERNLWAACGGPSRKRGRSAPRTPRGTLSMEKEFPESQAGEIPRRPLPTGVPPGTLNIVGTGMQRSPKAVRLRRTPMFGSRRTDVLEFLSGHGRQRSPRCQDAEKNKGITKAPLPDKNPLTRHERSLPVCLLGRPG